MHIQLASAALEPEKVRAQAKCPPSQSITASISHSKHFVHTLRPTTCVAFGSLRTLDTVTDGRGSKLSHRGPSRNSTECQKHPIAAQERLKGYICSTLLLVWFSTCTRNLTPAGVQGSANYCCEIGPFISILTICPVIMNVFFLLSEKSIFRFAMTASHILYCI